MRDRRRPVQQINPRAIRKRNTVSPTERRVAHIPGDRVHTTTGFRIEGYKGAFETFVEALAPFAATDWLRQTDPTQVRVVRILEGEGVYLEKDEDGEITEHTLVVGTELVIDTTLPFSILTVSGSQLDLMVMQTAGYEESLEVVEHVGAVGDVANLVTAYKPDTPVQAPRRASNSRASEQLQELRQAQHFVRNLRAREQRELPGLGPIKPQAGLLAAGDAGVNPRPTGGQFDPNTAG